MHRITIICNERLSVKYCIDDHIEIELTKRMAKIDLLDVYQLCRIVDDIECALAEIKPLTKFVDQLNGKNFFRILDALFYETALTNWKLFYEDYICKNEVSFRKAFEYYYGFHPRKRPFFAKIYDEIGIWSVGKNQQKRTDQYITTIYAENDKYKVKYIETVGNVASFMINNQETIEICLVGQPEYRSADRVLELISKIRTALSNKQDNDVRQVIKSAGATVFLQIAKCLYHHELCSFLTVYAKTTVMNDRTILLPRVIMKSFFGTKTNQYYLDLLEMLEKLIPWANNYLITTNLLEAASHKKTWLLYAPRGTGVFYLSITFKGPETFIAEAQEYCRKEVELYERAGKPCPNHIYSIVQAFNYAIDALSEVGSQINSVLDLTAFQVKTIGWIIAEQKHLATNTQRCIMLNLRSLFEFVAAQTKSNKRSPFPPDVFPRRQLNPTQPISSDDLAQLSIEIEKEPEYIQIAVSLAIATGARANSICELTVDDFSYDGKQWIVTVTHYKTIESKEVSITRVALDPLLAERIQIYIRQTEHLRKQLNIPYLLVYQPHHLRSGSARKPVILSASTFRYAIAKLFPQLPLYDPDGNPIFCSFKTLRATFGKELFLEGVSAEESALRMGNSPLIKGQHYTMLSPLEEAQLRHTLYDDTLVPILSSANQPTPVQTNSAVMYGSCEINKICNHHDCSVCKYLITCKESKQERGDVNAH